MSALLLLPVNRLTRLLRKDILVSAVEDGAERAWRRELGVVVMGVRGIAGMEMAI